MQIYESRKFTAIMEADGLFNAVRSHTRISCESSTLLGLSRFFITNVSGDDVTTESMVSDISDHVSIF